MPIPKKVSYGNHERYRPVFLYNKKKNNLITTAILLDKGDKLRPVAVGRAQKWQGDSNNMRLAREISFCRGVKSLEERSDWFDQYDIYDVLDEDEVIQFNHAYGSIKNPKVRE